MSDEPAFPIAGGYGMRVENAPGMALRDYFAAKAMQALTMHDIGKDGFATIVNVARDAYRLADAMLEARKQ